MQYNRSFKSDSLKRITLGQIQKTVMANLPPLDDNDIVSELDQNLFQLSENEKIQAETENVELSSEENQEYITAEYHDDSSNISPITGLKQNVNEQNEPTEEDEALSQLDKEKKRRAKANAYIETLIKDHHFEIQGSEHGALVKYLMDKGREIADVDAFLTGYRAHTVQMLDELAGLIKGLEKTHMGFNTLLNSFRHVSHEISLEGPNAKKPEQVLVEDKKLKGSVVVNIPKDVPVTKARNTRKGVVIAGASSFITPPPAIVRRSPVSQQLTVEDVNAKIDNQASLKLDTAGKNEGQKTIVHTLKLPVTVDELISSTGMKVTSERKNRFKAGAVSMFCVQEKITNADTLNLFVSDPSNKKRLFDIMFHPKPA